MKSPIIFIFAFLLFFSVSLVSAFGEFTRVDETLKEDLVISDSAMKYPAISIKGFWDALPFVEDEKATAVLTQHTESCGINCMSEFQIITNQESALIDDIKFYTITDKEKYEQSIRNYQFSYWGNIIDYETKCVDLKTIIDEKNGTEYTPQECSQVEIGSHEDWIPFTEGQIFDAGTYKIRLTGEKKPSRNVDWIIKTQNKVISEWAIWGNISLGNDAEVILNSPANDSIQYTNPVTFNASANITGGAYLTNMSFCSNITGSWGCGDSIGLANINSTDLVSYYKLDETTGDVVDSHGTNNGTNYGATRGVTGKINNAFSFDGTNDYIEIADTSDLRLLSGGTYNGWLYSDGDRGFLIAKSDGIQGVGGYVIELGGLGAGGKHALDIALGSGWDLQISDIIPTGAWHMVTVTWDGSDIYAYLDGSEIGHSVTGALPDDDGANDIFIGKRYSNDQFYGGDFDEIGIWSRALTSDEITSLYNSGAGLTYTTTTTTTTTTQTWSKTIPAGTTLWNVQACDSDGDCGFSVANYTVSLDADAPTIEINAGNGTQNYGSLTQNHTINFTVTDTNLDSVIFNYNGTNKTITGATSGVMNSTEFQLVKDLYNATIYANDTAGNLNTITFGWDYKVFENSMQYLNQTSAGTIGNYTYNFTLGSTIDLTEAIFYYNGTSYSPRISSSGQNRIVSINNLEVSTPQTNTNYTFYLYMALSDSTKINSTTRTQLVRAVLLDNCSVYTNRLFNITLRNEQTKALLNGDIQMGYTLLNKPSYKTIASYNFSVTNKNTTQVCSGLNLSGEDLVYSAEIRYTSSGYVAEFYNIQRANIGTTAQVLNLYDLNESDSTEFKITYQDDNFNFVEGAIVQLLRKYISEDTYEVVEAPLTSNEGIAVVHIDLDSIKYKAIVVKNGEVLDTFDNLVFKCQSELTGECEQKLLGTIDPQNVIDYDTERDFIYSVSQENNTLIVTFSIPSGEPSQVNIVLSQKDEFGNETICNRTVTSSAGSISCDYNETLGVSYLELKIYKDGEPVGYNTYRIDEETGLDFLDNNYIFVLVLILSIVGMALSSPEWIVINSILTLLFSGMIWLVNGIGFVAGLGILMWLVIAAGILILKLSKQEDR